MSALWRRGLLFRSLVPRCNAPNLPSLVAAMATLAAVVLAGGLIALGWHTFRSAGAPSAQDVAVRLRCGHRARDQPPLSGPVGMLV
jgi:hypothetical protein